MKRSVAIDGPSGSGKSTIAKMTAKKYDFIYVDTGAIYRSVGLFAKMNGVASKDREAVEGLLSKIKLDLSYDADGTQHMILNGEDVSEKIRTPDVSIYASDVSAMPGVRAFLLEMQRELARRRDVVMDGRDIGTVVLPDASVKIFLTASPEARAKRRYLELRAKGVETELDEVLRDMEYRDKNDSSRKIAPLKAAEDSVLIDTTFLTLDESANAVSKVISEKLGL